MRVAIDRGPLESGHKVRGVGVYTRELIKTLKNPSTPSATLRTSSLRTSLKKRELKIDAVNFEKAELGKYDLVHYPYFHPFLPTFYSLDKIRADKLPKIVVTVHDLIQLVYPAKYRSGIKGALRFIKQKKIIRKAVAIIVPSETTKKDVVRFLGVPERIIKVVYEAPRDIFRPIADNDDKLKEIKLKYKLPEKFVLYVGDVNYNKNIPGLLMAARIAKTPLVICGKQALENGEGTGLDSLQGPKDWARYIFNIPHPELSHLANLARQFNENSKIYRLGFVPDEDLAGIYNLANVYCQPSFYEGFGLPVLEAFSCGTPVVIAKTQALVEIADRAALIADPYNPKDFADKLKLLINDNNLRKTYSLRGKTVARKFTWKKAAEETFKVYAEAFENN